MVEQKIELAPGESKLVSFEAVPSVARVYTVNVEGLSGQFKAVAPDALVMTLVNPKFGNLWDARILGAPAGVPTGPKTIGESCSFKPSDTTFLMTVQESVSLYDLHVYGPYLVWIPEFGAYDWDSRAGRMGSFTAIDLPAEPNKSLIVGTFYSASANHVQITVRSTQVISGMDAAYYFIGQTILIRVGYRAYMRTGDEVRIEASLVYGEYEAEWVGNNLFYTGGFPDYAYQFSGSLTTGVDRWHLIVTGNVSPFSIAVVALSCTGTGIYGITYEVGPINDPDYKGLMGCRTYIYAHPQPGMKWSKDIIRFGLNPNRWVLVDRWIWSG